MRPLSATRLPLLLAAIVVTTVAASAFAQPAVGRTAERIAIIGGRVVLGGFGGALWIHDGDRTRPLPSDDAHADPFRWITRGDRLVIIGRHGVSTLGETAVAPLPSIPDHQILDAVPTARGVVSLALGVSCAGQGEDEVCTESDTRELYDATTRITGSLAGADLLSFDASEDGATIVVGVARESASLLVLARRPEGWSAESSYPLGATLGDVPARVALSPSARYAVAFLQGGTVVIVDRRGGEPRRVSVGEGASWAWAFDAAEERLAVAHARTSVTLVALRDGTSTERAIAPEMVDLGRDCLALTTDALLVACQRLSAPTRVALTTTAGSASALPAR
ncbi:hypothetical protein [Sandaracinus amylolyticus]|uniref:Uncharacterized protein n=1 Tax=Sandaracinus amylolyticus TaxID=927083 RepID=A0A0F6YIL4_9BACT|nr:hypothetical protein [Sandaracinus amylolyticus]AKF06247.1 hypothetical protein DB32_003396 [Sandaracinus amylolyticus]